MANSTAAGEAHGIPPTAEGMTMAEWIASWFFTVDGATWCRVCGCMVHPEWAGDHYESLHGFKGL